MRKNSSAARFFTMFFCLTVMISLIVGLFVSCGHKDNTPYYWTTQDLVKTAIKQTECTDTAVSVTMQNEKFTPQEVTIPQGGSVKWTNNDPVGHNYYLVFQDVTINSVASGQSVCLKFTVKGKYPYHCDPTVTGTVIVE